MFFQYKRSLILALLALLALFIAAGVSAQEDRPSDCAPTQPDGWVVYVVQQGDNLSDIAARSQSSIDALQRANCLDNPRRLVVGQSLFVPQPPVVRPVDHFLRRCLNAGFSEQQCRRIWNGLHSDDDHSFAERCTNAGYTPEECRRIWNALNGDDNGNIAERCQAAGYTIEECRRLINDNGDDNGGLLERCRAAGYTAEECRRLYNASQDDGSVDDRGTQDRTRDQTQDRTQDRTQDQTQDQNQDRSRDHQSNDNSGSGRGA